MIGNPRSATLTCSSTGDAEAVLAPAIAALELAGAPKGSRARLDERDPVTFGVTQGLAVNLNGTDVPDEVYATNDVNELVAALLDSLGDEGQMQSQWQGSRETALYLYGPSSAHMTERITDVLRRFPLAQGCRVVPFPAHAALSQLELRRPRVGGFLAASVTFAHFNDPPCHDHKSADAIRTALRHVRLQRSTAIESWVIAPAPASRPTSYRRRSASP
jgi:hypothetical protein